MATHQICAFETWHNEGTQISAFHTGKDAIKFIESHGQSGTLSSLHIYYDVEFGRGEYDATIEIIEFLKN
jgi:hypothetical protein